MIVGERKGMRLSDLRHRITLQEPTRTVDAARQPVVTWADELTDQPARYSSVSGGETNRGRQVEAGVVAVFTVTHRSNYAVDKQIIFRGTNYGIARVDHIDGINRFIDLHCKAVPSVG